MTDTLAVRRSALAMLLCLPIAVLVGAQLADPYSRKAIAVVFLVVGVLSFPLLLRWHHPLVIVSWNTQLMIPFLPGQPHLWIVLSFISFGMTIVTQTLRRQSPRLRVAAVDWSLIFLGLVIVITAQVTGGLATRVLGSELWGGKRYLFVLGAILGYFALTSQQVALPSAPKLAWLFVLGGVTAALSDLAYHSGPAFFFLFYFLPVDLAVHQAMSGEVLWRLSGIGFAAQSFYWYLLIRYGLRGLLDLFKPWRLITFVAALALTLLGGFRSTIVVGTLLLIVQFFLEGLHRTRFLTFVLCGLVLVGTFTVAFIRYMPTPVQRSLSFLPVDVDPMARRDAQSTVDWRLEMWKVVVPQIPKYLLLGKGFLFDGTDYYLTSEAIRRGMLTAYDDTLITGNYHHGILTLIIPFGIWGMIGFTWFAIASLRVVHRNYRYGDPSLHLVNTFLFASFISRLIFYLFFYGQFDFDLYQFAGMVGLSITLNGGVRKPEDLEEPRTAVTEEPVAT